MPIKQFSLKKNLLIFFSFSIIIFLCYISNSPLANLITLLLVIISFILLILKGSFLKIKQKVKVNSKKKYLKLNRYSELLNYMDPLYEWEKKNYPFLSQFPAFRFACKNNSQKLEDYQSVYINSKENLIYTFNLINQSYSLSLEAFMIDDIKEFYVSLELEESGEEIKKNFLKFNFLTNNKTKKNSTNKIEEDYSLLVKDIKLVFSFLNKDIKPLEAYLYPPSADKLPYLISKNDINYNLIIDKAFSIISLLEVLQGGFFLEQDKNISLDDGILRIKI